MERVEQFVHEVELKIDCLLFSGVSAGIGGK